MNKDKMHSIVQIVIATFMFGTVGIFRKNITLPSGTLAMIRGLIGSTFLIILQFINSNQLHLTWGGNRKMLIVSGALIGFNWILLFEAYSYTSVAIVTMCYYMQPIIVTLTSPFVTHTRLSTKSIVCSLAAILGMVLVSNVMETNIRGSNDLKGILLGLAAAVLYAVVIFMNQSFSKIEAIPKTIVQLLAASICIFPYVLLKESPFSISWTSNDILYTIILGIFITGLSYSLYFAAMKNLTAVETASFSYVDPVTALVLANIFLSEKMTLLQIFGVIIILFSTLLTQCNIDVTVTTPHQK